MLSNIMKRVFCEQNKQQNKNSDINPQEDICRICLSYTNSSVKYCDLISPCNCKGSMKFVHRSCLQIWRYKGRKLSENGSCEQCKSKYKLADAFSPRKCILHMMTIFIIVLVNYTVNFVISTFIEAYVLTMQSRGENNNQHDIILRLLSGRQVYIYETSANQPLQLPTYILSPFMTSIIVILLYFVITTSNVYKIFWITLFTVKSIIYNLEIDRYILGLLLLLSYRVLYMDIYKYMESYMFFMFNFI